jgi:threonine/homoserine/homoserine lactone efflux protein
MEREIMFASALAVAYLLPGPDMLLVLQTGTTRGRLCALSAAAGLAAARALHVTLAACGLGALFLASPDLFQAARLLGAAYLLWLGFGLAKSGPLMTAITDMPATVTTASLKAAMRRGFLTNLLNPKALLFCSMLLPQFLPPETTNLAAAFARLGLILVAMGAGFDALLAFAGARLGGWLRSHPKAAQAQQWSFALLLIGFGLRLGLGGLVD